jgi:hypothetical protein
MYMGIEIKEVSDKKGLKDFVNVPLTIYRGNPYWVPPLRNDELKALLPASNPLFGFVKQSFGWPTNKVSP